MISGYFLIFRLICLNLNLNLVRKQVQTREELKNYLVIPMLTVSCSRPVELDQTISSIIKNPESYQTVARLTCIGGKRHIILVLGLCDFKLDLELQTWIMKKSGWIWSTTKKHHEKLGQKITLIGQKNRTNRVFKMFRFFMFFFAVQILILCFFWEIQSMLELNNIPITMSKNHFWIRSYSLDGNQSDSFSYQLTGLLLCASDIADL